LWGINPESLGYAERAYRTWCETAGEIQSHATQFLNNRLAKDYAAIAELGQCKTPVEVFSAQVAYASKTFADLVDEGQKVVAYLSNMATQGILNGSVEQLASVPKSRVTGRNGRSHRVAGH
jgi:phosphoribosylformylglycinamidine (FGAM) synthase-like amidotransferase family enzyme